MAADSLFVAACLLQPHSLLLMMMIKMIMSERVSLFMSPLGHNIFMPRKLPAIKSDLIKKARSVCLVDDAATN